MRTAYDTYLELKDKAPGQEEQTTEQRLQSARETILKVRQATLPAIADNASRQLGGMLFSNALMALKSPFIFGEPRVFEEALGGRQKNPGVFLAICATALQALAVFLTREQQLFWPMLLQLAALVFFGLTFFFAFKPGKKASYRVDMAIDPEKLDALICELMHMIDRDLEAVLSLACMENPQEISDSALDAMMKIYETEAQAAHKSPEITQAIAYYLKQNGLTQVEYTPHNAPMFQTLPTRAATRTLVPALLKDHLMVRQGLAIVKKEDTE